VKVVGGVVVVVDVLVVGVEGVDLVKGIEEVEESKEVDVGSAEGSGRLEGFEVVERVKEFAGEEESEGFGGVEFDELDDAAGVLELIVALDSAKKIV
jgi:hypothetical protein